MVLVPLVAPRDKIWEWPVTKALQSTSPSCTISVPSEPPLEILEKIRAKKLAEQQEEDEKKKKEQEKQEKQEKIKQQALERQIEALKSKIKQKSEL